MGLVCDGLGAKADCRSPATLQPTGTVPRYPPISILFLVAERIPRKEEQRMLPSSLSPQEGTCKYSKFVTLKMFRRNKLVAE